MRGRETHIELLTVCMQISTGLEEFFFSRNLIVMRQFPGRSVSQNQYFIFHVQLEAF